jgi:hypothetical protein
METSAPETGGRLEDTRIVRELTPTCSRGRTLSCPARCVGTIYLSASAAAKAEWDRMMEKLKAHEQRHMDIAIQHGNALVQELVGNDMSVIAQMVTDRNRQMAADQQQLDADTDHGSKPGTPYGDVFLDTSIV